MAEKSVMHLTDFIVNCPHPILLYGCEKWMDENMDVVLKMQLRLLKLILGAKATTWEDIR